LTVTNQQIRLQSGKTPEVSSHKIEGYRTFGTNLLWMAVNVYILLTQGDCICVFYSYCPGKENLQNETLFSVTCGELLAMYTAGTLKGKVTLSVSKVNVNLNLEQATKLEGE